MSERVTKPNRGLTGLLEDSLSASVAREPWTRGAKWASVPKYILFFENFILVLVGLALTAIGTYILVLKEKVVHSALDFFLDPACDMCLVGCIVFVLAFLGCLGSLREVVTLLKVYHAVLSLFLFLELGVAVVFFLIYYVEDVRNAVFPEDAFNDAIVNYREDQDTRDFIDSLQKSLGCCGLSDSDTGYENWNNNIYFNCTLDSTSPEKCSVPPSCCKIQAGQKINLECGSDIYTFVDGKREVLDTSRIYTDGCLKALGDWVNENSLILGGVLLGILLPQMFIICLSRNLIDMINKQKARWNR
ncbi:tetraspanin-33-like [Babylonia areolata]|uniref:tetraspanin-33-like n=1 Tax=Babylonia areolata TaxID=304850 RepID=UPI003FD67ED9